MDVHFGSVSGLTVELVREVFGGELKDFVNSGYATDGNGGDPVGAGVIRYDQTVTARGIVGSNQITFGVKNNKAGLRATGSRFDGSQEISSVTLAQMEP